MSLDMQQSCTRDALQEAVLHELEGAVERLTKALSPSLSLSRPAA